MSEIVWDWTAILGAIQTELEAVTSLDGGALFNVLAEEPTGLPLDVPGQAYARFWYAGRTDPEEGRQTLGNVMYAGRVPIMCFFPYQPERVTRAAQEAEIATADTSIRRRLRVNETLNDQCSRLDIEDSDVTYGDVPASTGGKLNLYRILSMEVHLVNLEGEEIGP